MILNKYSAPGDIRINVRKKSREKELSRSPWQVLFIASCCFTAELKLTYIWLFQNSADFPMVGN